MIGNRAKVVGSAEMFPEVPGARVVVQREGGYLPDGFWRVLYRVIHLPRHADKCLRDTDGHPLDILLVAPMPSQKWWEHYVKWQRGRSD